MAKATIRHLAIVAKDPEKLAEYYKRVFGMEETHRDDKSKKERGKIGVFLTDGYLALAILPLRLEGENGLGVHHFGFHIDSMDEVTGNMEAEDVEAPQLRPGDRPFAEFRGMDPEGNLFDLSEHGYQRIETGDERAVKK